MIFYEHLHLLSWGDLMSTYTYCCRLCSSLGDDTNMIILPGTRKKKRKVVGKVSEYIYFLANISVSFITFPYQERSL